MGSNFMIKFKTVERGMQLQGLVLLIANNMHPVCNNVNLFVFAVINVRVLRCTVISRR